MTNEEAKFLLQGYRPNGADAENPALAEALGQAERDPALRAWFEREQAFDGIVAAKLAEVAAPAGLRESILAGTKLSTAPAVAERSARSWWRSVGVTALAAAAAVVLAAVWWLNPATGGDRVVSLPSADVLLKTALADYRGAHGMGPHADELGAFGRWLEAGDTRLGTQVMPVDFAKLREQGCRVVQVGGYELFEICFLRDGRWYHVYIAPRSDFDPESVHDEPMFHEQGQFVAAAWADRENVYLVSSTAGIEALRGLL